MDWQLIVVMLIVAGAAGYLGRQTWRTWSGKKAGCGGGCGCSKSPDGATVNGSTTLIPPEQLTLLRRDHRG